jgi:tripartite motif-containing protein 71
MKTRSLLSLLLVVVATPCGATAPPTLLFKFGTQGPGPGQLNTPLGLCVAPSGHVYVADSGNHRLQEFDANGTFIRTIGDATVFVDEPGDVAVRQDGTVFVANISDIKVFSASGQPQQPFQLAIGASGVVSVALDPAEQYLYALYGTGEIQEFDMAGNRGLKWYATAPFGEFPGFSVDPSRAVVVVEGCTVIRYRPDGTIVSIWSRDTNCGGFYSAAVDANNLVYAADMDQKVDVFDLDGTFRNEFGADAQILTPRDIGIGPQGRIYVLDAYLNNVAVFGYMPTPVRRPTWGRLKAMYR